MSVVSLVRWGAQNPRPERISSRTVSGTTLGGTVLPFPDGACRVPPGGVPRPDDPPEPPPDGLPRSFILRRLVLGAVALAAIAAAFVAGMISTALAKDPHGAARLIPLLGRYRFRSKGAQSGTLTYQKRLLRTNCQKINMSRLSRHHWNIMVHCRTGIRSRWLRSRPTRPAL